MRKKSAFIALSKTCLSSMTYGFIYRKRNFYSGIYLFCSNVTHLKKIDLKTDFYGFYQNYLFDKQTNTNLSELIELIYSCELYTVANNLSVTTTVSSINIDSFSLRISTL